MTEEKINNNPEEASVQNTEEQKSEPVYDNKESELEHKIVVLEENITSLNDKLLRLAAELDNTRRRNAEEVDKANKYAISSFAGELVLVVENFYLAADYLPQEEIDKSSAVKHFADAMVMTKKELTKILEKNNIKRIYPLGEKFDHNYHEAISRVEAIEGEEDGVVKQVIQAGYSIGQRLIRPALVVVANQN